MGRVDGKTSHSSDVLLPAKLVASWSSDEQEHWSAGRKRSHVMLAMLGLASLESYEIAVMDRMRAHLEHATPDPTNAAGMAELDFAYKAIIG
jgi:hypothetical protein